MIRSLIGSLRTQGRVFRLSRPRWFSNEGKTDPELTEGEKKILGVLQSRFPSATEIQVSDISGGCGAMYEISIEANDFQGMRTVKQHMLVNDALKQEIKDMHGLRINTRVPE